MFEDLNIPVNIKHILSNAVIYNKISHAYLFFGNDDEMLNIIAKEFSKAILCQTRPHTCGICSSCKKVQTETHPDIIKIYPDAKESISIKQIKGDLIKKIKFLPYESHKKIYIIYKADTMQKPAQNSLLKILEEPNDYAIIIMLAKTKHAFYPTVLSRCQVFDFGRIKTDQHVTDMVFSALYNTADDDYESLMEKSAIMSEEDLSTIISVTASALRDLMVYRLTQNSCNIVNKSKIDQIERISKLYSIDKLKKTIDYIYDIRINASTNKKLVIHAIFLYLGI